MQSKQLCTTLILLGVSLGAPAYEDDNSRFSANGNWATYAIPIGKESFRLCMYKRIRVDSDNILLDGRCKDSKGLAMSGLGINCMANTLHVVFPQDQEQKHSIDTGSTLREIIRWSCREGEE